MTKLAANAVPKRLRLRHILPGIVLWWSLSAFAAADAFALFERFIADKRMTKMHFQQTVSDEKGAVLETARGTLWYQSPNRFRLEFNDSTAHPLIISDGETLWLYEADIKQVIVRPIQSVQKSGLLSILSGEGLDSLRDSYILTAGLADNLIWLNAEASAPTDSVRAIRLGFNGASGDLQQVNITDVFDGVVRLSIESINRQATDEQLFSFSLPPNTDVLTLDD